MNILEAMDYVRAGRRVILNDTVLKQGKSGELLRDHSREFKLKREEPYVPSHEEMLSNDWELVLEEVTAGTAVEIDNVVYVICTGYRERRYLIDMLNARVVFEYENETLLLKDIYRRGGVILP